MNKASKLASAVVLFAVVGVIATATAQESRSPLWNFNSPQKAVEQQQLQSQSSEGAYAPVRPPAGSNPGVLKEPELIARDLNEDDAAYTARMAQKLTAEQALTTQLMASHEALLERIRQGLPIDDAQSPVQSPENSVQAKRFDDQPSPRSRPLSSSETE